MSMFDEPEDDYWDVAQVCLNGHLVTSTAATYPQHQEKFCSRCGAQTLTLGDQLRRILADRSGDGSGGPL